MKTFRHEGRTLAYTEYGDGSRIVVLLHGLLLSQRMHEPLAKALAARGNRVITLDLLGHGSSERPLDPQCYSMTFFGEQVIALLDHLEVDEAVVLGTSLGANVAIETAALAPERLRGMVIEMPVLDGALLACAVAFTPLMLALSFGEPLMRVVQAGAKRVPRLPWLLDFVVDTVRQDPAPGAAVLQGLFFGRIAPHRGERRRIETPTLVIGHRRPPVLRRRHARRGAPERPPARGRLDHRAADRARAAHPRDRRLHRRVLATALRRPAHAQGELGEPLA
jgi:pimeloyl-ACP methyl ester carboxylesterase